VFLLIRVIICLVIFGSVCVLIRKRGVQRKGTKYILCGIICGILFVVMGFIPLENSFHVFSSAEEAYEYRNPRAKSQLVVSGESCDFVVGYENGYSVNMFVPKDAQGWRVGIGTEPRVVAESLDGDAIIYIYQFKDTDDYFIIVYGFEGTPIEIVDSCESEFLVLDKAGGKDFCKYYAYIPEFDDEYWIKNRTVSVFEWLKGTTYS